MKKVHVHPETAEILDCGARKEPCPFLKSHNVQHFTSYEEAKPYAEQLAEHIAQQEQRKQQLMTAYKLYGKNIHSFDIEFSPSVNSLVRTLRKHGLRPLLVGGAVRDAVMNNSSGQVINSKDLDFEIYADSNENIENRIVNAASEIQHVDEVGKSFGVFKTTLDDGTEIDLSMPRKEVKTGTGHTGFSVEPDVTMSIPDAAARRDFTLNAMSYDNENKVLIDPYNGLEDLKNKRLRHTSEAFAEDPLRVLRSFQFASRFDMEVAPETVKLSEQLLSEYDTISTERIQVEWDKWATRGKTPSAGLKVLHDTQWNKSLPGLRENTGDKMFTSVDRMGSQCDADKTLPRNVMLPATVMANIVHEDDQVQQQQRDEFARTTIMGKKNQRAAVDLANSVDNNTVGEIQSVEDARVASLQHKTSLRQKIAMYEAFHGEEAAEIARAKSVESGVFDEPEKDIIGGQDVLTVVDRKPGPWVAESLGELRLAQARGEFRTYDEGIAFLKNSQ